MLNFLCCYLCYVISIFICIITNIQVLFHLLDRVRESSTTADKEKIESGGGNILIHHSRDTAEKQWAETWVLTLAGVARIFNTRRYLLQPLGRGTFFLARDHPYLHILPTGPHMAQTLVKVPRVPETLGLTEAPREQGVASAWGPSPPPGVHSPESTPTR